MTITLHWWALPAILTVLWALFSFWPMRGEWGELCRPLLAGCALILVLLAWIVGLIFLGITQ